MKKLYYCMLLIFAAYIMPADAVAQETVAYDYDFKATVLCDASWYGIRRSEGNHSVHNYYIVLGDKTLTEEGNPAAGSTVYALDFFGKAPADEYNPQPAEGVYTFSNAIGDNVLFNDIHVYQLDGNGNYEIDRGFTDGTLTISSYEKDGNKYYKYDAVLTDELGKSHHVTYESRFITYNNLSQGDLNLEKDLDFTCKHAHAKFRSMAADGTMKIDLELSDLEWDGEDYITSGVPFYRQMMIELFMPSGSSLANGTYVPSDDVGSAFTMNTGEIVNEWGIQYAVGSYMQYVYDGNKLAWGCVKTGSLTVSGEGDNKIITGNFETDYGFTIKFVYEGELPVANIPQSGLTDDLALDLEGATAEFDCVGDVDGLNNCRNWYITILPADGKDHGFISYICSRGKTFNEGITTDTYTASPSTSIWKGEYAKGKKNSNGQLSGTWALTSFDADGVPQVNAPASSGDLNITQHDDKETYTIEFKLNDGIGHDFTGTWTGKPKLINSCGDEVTVIKRISSDTSKKVAGIYDLNGRKVAGNAPGIYLIRYNDGSVSKRIVK